MKEAGARRERTSRASCDDAADRPRDGIRGRRVSCRTGLESGDVIAAVNRSRIRSAEQAAELFRYHAGRGQILVRACRGGTLFTTSFFIRG